MEMVLWKDMPDAALFGDAPPRRHDPELITWLAQHSERPLYVSKPFALPEGAGLRFTRQGLLLRVEKDDAPDEPAPPPDLRDLPPANTTDYTGKLILLDLEMAWAAHQLEAHDRDAALARLRNAALLFPGDPRIGNNLGIWCARNGFPEEAAYLFQEALHAGASHLPDDPAVALLRDHLQRISDRPM
ncbi:MAG: hypothetical protein HC888_19455 [Candidatus Competibacteraceae bacterium]|nr:hypothetical protein [Candidatus Competibacteraceae bacterium]